MRATARLEGLESLASDFNRKVKQMGDYTIRGMTDVVLDLRRKSSERAPKKEGFLRASGYAKINGMFVYKTTRQGINSKLLRTVEDVESENLNTQDVVWGEVGFGEEYAMIQHERLDFKHTDGEAKYLENPLDENTERYLKMLEDSVDKGVGD